MSLNEIPEEFMSFLNEGEKIIHVSRESRTILVGVFIFASLPLSLITFIWFYYAPGWWKSIPMLLIFLILYLPYASWKKKYVILTENQILFIDGLSETVKKVPLERVEQVTVSPSFISIRSGSSVFNELKMYVSDPKELAAKIEQVRARLRMDARQY